jgi:hypothetical protein
MKLFLPIIAGIHLLYGHMNGNSRESRNSQWLFLAPAIKVLLWVHTGNNESVTHHQKCMK